MTIEEAIVFLNEHGYEVRKKSEPREAKWTYAARERMRKYYRQLSHEDKIKLGGSKKAIDNAWGWARKNVLDNYGLHGLNHVPDDLKDEVSEELSSRAIAYMYQHILKFRNENS